MDTKQLLAKVIEKHGGEWLEKIPVLTGNRAGVVDAGDGKIWIRFTTGLEAEVINTLAPLAFDRHILIGRLRSQPAVWRVAEIRENYIQSSSNQPLPHHLQHEYGGFDQLSIHRKQVISATAFVSDSANFLVRVYGGLFFSGGAWVLAESTDGTPAHPDLDLSSYVPTDGALYVGIESDDTGALVINPGTPFTSPELATGADVPIPPDGSRLIAFVLLFETQTELLDEHISVPGLFAAPEATGGVVDWGDIGGTLSDQTDLQTALDAKQPLDSDLTAIAGLAPSNDDVIQRKAGAWTNRTIAQLKADLAITAGHSIEDEGTPLTARSKLNFVGGGITATDDSGDDASVVTVSAQTIGDLIEGSTNKATPVDADRFGFWDSVADILKYATWANIKATLKTYFDTLYALTANGVTNGNSHNHVGGDGAVLYFYQAIPGHAAGGTIAASTTMYVPPFSHALNASRLNFVLPRGGTLKNFRWNTNSAQPASGSLVGTVQLNNADCALTATVAAGGAAQSVSDLSNTVAVSAGDAISFELTNNATGASAQIGSLSMELEIPTA